MLWCVREGVEGLKASSQGGERERERESDRETHLSVAEHFQHVRVEGLHGLVMACEDLFLNGAEVQWVGHLLVVLRVPLDTHTHTHTRVRDDSRGDCSNISL